MTAPVTARPIFDGLPTGAAPGAVFPAGTYYIPVMATGGGVHSLHLQGDGTAVATATLMHSDFTVNMDGTAINPRVAGIASNWDTDAEVGTLTIAASVTETGQDRKTWSNQPRVMSRIVLVVTVEGRIRGSMSAVS